MIPFTQNEDGDEKLCKNQKKEPEILSEDQVFVKKCDKKEKVNASTVMFKGEIKSPLNIDL